MFNFIPRHEFEKSVLRHGADAYVKKLTTWQQFLILLYAQASGKKSLRDIRSSLEVHQGKLYHLGIKTVARSTLSDAMNLRSSEVFSELFEAVFQRAQGVAPGHRFKFKNPLYRIDSTTIDLCLSTFDWARFRRQKGAIKLHCLLDHRGHLPAFMVLSDGKTHDLTTARLCFEPVPDSIYCFDKGYLDFRWLDSIDQKKAFFVTRAKDNLAFEFVGQQPPSLDPAVLADDRIELSGPSSRLDYPSTLRLIQYQDPVSGKVYSFLTNHFKLAASTVAAIYQQRWQIELFFKWIKQNLKIKTFIGTSRNAVLAQVWTAMIYYLLLAYLKFLSRSRLTITELSRRLNASLLDKFDLIEIINGSPPRHPVFSSDQLTLFPP